MSFKFRGKRKDTGEVVEGFLCNDYLTEELFIQHRISFEKHPKWISSLIEIDSLAVSTGQKDKNGKEIFGSFEIDGKMTRGGDRVKIKDTECTVEFCDSAFELIEMEGRFYSHLWCLEGDIEIIGRQDDGEEGK